MKRFAVYRDISPTYVRFDRVTATVAGLFLNQRDAERAAPAGDNAHIAGGRS